LTMLLHDIGKPFCKTRDCNMNDHFYGHPAVSAELAAKALKALKVPNDLYDRVLLLISIHDKYITTDKKNVKKWLGKIGKERTLDLIDVKKADMLSQNTELTLPEINAIEKTRQVINEILENNEAFSVKNLAVNGYDLLSLGLQGEDIGRTLNTLLDKVINEDMPNTKDSLLLYVKENIL
ncbi:MAG: HD domain-containing protein, partial [Eubacterium sp.]